MSAELSPVQQTYLERLNAIEAERNAAMSTPGAHPEQLNIVMLHKMSAALAALRATQRKKPRT